MVELLFTSTLVWCHTLLFWLTDPCRNFLLWGVSQEDYSHQMTTSDVKERWESACNGVGEERNSSIVTCSERYYEKKCLNMKDNQAILHLISQSAMSAVSTSLFIPQLPHPRFNFHTCEQQWRVRKFNNNSLVLFFELRLSERPWNEWWIGFTVTTKVFSCFPSWVTQRGDLMGGGVWKSWGDPTS